MVDELNPRKVLAALRRYMVARESLTHGRRTDIELDRVNTAEDDFGDEIKKLIDARCEAIVAEKLAVILGEVKADG